VGRTQADLDSTAQEAAQAGHDIELCGGNIADAAVAERAVLVAESRGWWVQHLVCNAGMGKSGPTESFDPNLWRRIFDVNVHGTFYFIQACLPQMLNHGVGSITIVSSLAGIQGVAFDCAYTASKHALVGLGRCLAKEYSKRGVLVATLCPSFVDSEMTDRTISSMMKRRGLTQAEARQRLADKTPAKRIVPAEEIAEAVAHIASGNSDAARELASRGGYPLILD
jgi:NAD(P)-dependent dehydrogenase (short-subunit alcohol dehydrogenase family)